jgi:hypothetical protein
VSWIEFVDWRADMVHAGSLEERKRARSKKVLQIRNLGKNHSESNQIRHHSIHIALQVTQPPDYLGIVPLIRTADDRARDEPEWWC